MNFFITGDLHGKLDFRKLQPPCFTAGRAMTPEDKLIILGDFGLPLDGLARYLDDLASRPCDILFLDGNHENFKALDGLPLEKRWGGTVGVLRPNVLHLRRGEVYRIGGTAFFVMGGAKSVFPMKGYTHSGREIPSEEEMARGRRNLDKLNWKVDYILTHTGPERLARKMFGEHAESCPVATYLDEILERTAFRRWFCGHYHRDIDLPDAKFHLLYERILRLNIPDDGRKRLVSIRARWSTNNEVIPGRI